MSGKSTLILAGNAKPSGTAALSGRSKIASAALAGLTGTLSLAGQSKIALKMSADLSVEFFSLSGLSTIQLKGQGVLTGESLICWRYPADRQSGSLLEVRSGFCHQVKSQLYRDRQEAKN